MDRAAVGLVLLEVAVLLAVIGLVADPLLRVAMALAVSLLLVQRALGQKQEETRSGFAERREDEAVRSQIEELLVRIREFYAACHLVRSQQIPEATGIERIETIEKDLNRILLEVTRASRGELAALRQQ